MAFGLELLFPNKTELSILEHGQLTMLHLEMSFSIVLLLHTVVVLLV